MPNLVTTHAASRQYTPLPSLLKSACHLLIEAGSKQGQCLCSWNSPIIASHVAHIVSSCALHIYANSAKRQSQSQRALLKSVCLLESLPNRVGFSACFWGLCPWLCAPREILRGVSCSFVCLQRFLRALGFQRCCFQFSGFVFIARVIGTPYV